MKIKHCVVFLFFCSFFLFACSSKYTLFEQLSSSATGIHFANTITETDTVNIMDFANVYNGGGVGIGDFNNDGLQDIYFTGNLVTNKLYLNKGDLKFEDVTDKAGVGGSGKWCRGASVVDINNDGLLDIYVCATIWKDAARRRNLLYINKGTDKDGIPSFSEEAEAYGLNDSTYSTSAAFFDYDNDGDLDVYIAVNQILEGEYPNKFRKLVTDGSFPSTGKLYRNEGSDSLGHPFFKNVSQQAGINYEGYSHGATIADINNDGWKDIYVTNDYLSTNVLYINQHDGTFKNEAKTYFKHTAANSMGQDIQDINNDGLQDVIELDMNPKDNQRKKMMLNPGSYQTYRNSDFFGYQYQYVRNTLQLNLGNCVKDNDSIGHPVFADIAFLSKIAETDWSWTPLVADFDNDGYKDIIITNGFPKDVTDHDFVAFRDKAYFVATKKQLLEQIPEVKISNYAFRNNGDLRFTDVSSEWGIVQPSFSNGAAFADFDNDGDLDYVVNNINDEAFLYKNKSNDKEIQNHFLSVKLKVNPPNINGLGAFIELYYDKGKMQLYENTPYRGYLSSVQQDAHFGLGQISMLDSVIVKWPDGKMQVQKNIKADQLMLIEYKNANESYSLSSPVFAKQALFTKITDSVARGIINSEDDYIDFNIQKLLPHKLSEYGPGLAVGDVNKDGLDDIVMGGSYGYSAQLLMQDSKGKLNAKNIINDATRSNKAADDLGVLLFDADGDSDPDLFIASGGYENKAASTNYQDKFYINDGKGNFTADSLAIPVNYTSKSCVRACDFDKDGDLDLFIAGRCLPEKYPQPVSCFIYRNDTKNGKIIFTDVTAEAAKGLQDIGMTCDALWTDFDNDGWTDLVLTGEFMPVKFFKNEHGKFVALKTAIDQQIGWWTCIAPGDFDNDGDIDYIVGNTGQNSFYRPTDKYPVRIYAKDFDNNGSFDAIPSVYLPSSSADTVMKEYPALLRDDMIKQMIEMRNKFKTYKDFAAAGMDKVLLPDQLKGALIVEANNFASSYIRNDGNGKFVMQPLPLQAQFSTLYGMQAEDVNNDGNLDVIINGNDYGTDVSIGRYDALNGLVMLGDGNGNFKPLSILQSGIYIPGNGKALVQFANKAGQCMIAAAQNRGPLEVFVMKQTGGIIKTNPDDAYALLKLKNGKTRKQELYYGAGYLSQSARSINRNAQVTGAEIVNNKAVKRTIQ